MNTLTETNTRLIASSRNWIEGEAVRQLCATARLPGVNLAVGLPDLHPGKGGPVGAAFVTRGVLYPYLIGGDIGCGMALFSTGLLRRKAKLDRWSGLRFDLEHPWEGDARERLASEGLCTTQFVESFGTLGGGNHFAEMQAVENIEDKSAFEKLGLAKDELVALVHSGSRGLGQAVLETYVEAHGANGVDTTSEAALSYLLLHDHAVSWARASRATLAERFVSALGGESARVLDAGHNSITGRNVGGGTVWIHRKGAAPSDQGPFVIPGSRGTLSYLVQPIGDGAAHGWSLAHGAGRKWTRSEARLRVRERFHHTALLQTGLGGRVICEERDLLYEEAPMAYKSIDVVIGDLVEAGLVTVIARLRPLLTYKTRKERR
jgi:release factor H-coupled RctB family protein